MKEMKEKNVKELEKMADDIDYSSVIARMAGQELTEAQKEECRKFDELYDATHPEKNG